MPKRLKTKYAGVYYHEHATRKHGRTKDRYFIIRHTDNGKRIEEGVGWASQGWSADNVHGVLSDLNSAKKTGNGETSLKEKRERLTAEKAEHERAVLAEKMSRKSVEEYSSSYLEAIELERAAKDYKVEKSYIERYINPVVGHIPAKDLSEIDVQRLKQQLEKTKSKANGEITKGKSLAPRTVEYILLILGKILKHAGIANSPTAKVKIKKYDNKNQRYFSREEVDLLFSELAKNNQTVCDQAMISLNLGLRAGEIFKLRKMHIDFKSGAVRIVDSKNKAKPRIVYMTPQAEEVLTRHTKGKKSHDLVFIDKKGKAFRQPKDIYYKTVKELGFNDGIKDRRFRADFHTLRHTYASWLIMNGLSIYTLQKLLGHQNIKTTERYAHLAPDNLKESAYIMERLSGGVNLKTTSCHTSSVG